VSEEFSYTLEDEKILEYLALSTEDKLNWLEEIVEFNQLVSGEIREPRTGYVGAEKAVKTK
jgi:hypothetical protein